MAMHFRVGSFADDAWQQGVHSLSPAGPRGIQMRSRIWIVIAAAALVAFAAIIIEKQRERAEAKRMMVWG